jgi:hypothetical protein
LYKLGIHLHFQEKMAIAIFRGQRRSSEAEMKSKRATQRKKSKIKESESMIPSGHAKREYTLLPR